MIEDPSILSSIIKEPVYFQIAFYIISAHPETAVYYDCITFH
jgi:hypothetical protein